MSSRQIAVLQGYPEDNQRLAARSDNSVVLLPIDLGQEYHKEQFMLSTLEVLRKIFPHAHVIVIIADELQAYNAFTKSSTSFSGEQLEKYRQQLFAEGQQWLISYKQDIETYLPSYEIKTWREFLNAENFTEVRDFILTLYEGTGTDDDNLKNSRFSNYMKVHDTLTETEQKYEDEHGPIPSERFKELVAVSARKKSHKNNQSKKDRNVINTKYILEECAVYLQWVILYLKTPDVFLIYPIDINPAMEYLKRKFSKNAITHLTIGFSPLYRVPFIDPKAGEHLSTRPSSTSDTFAKKSKGSDRRSLRPLRLPDNQLLLVPIPEEYHAKNIALVKLSFQKKLLELLELATRFDWSSDDEQIQSIIFSFLKRMAVDIPVITDKQNESPLKGLPEAPEKVQSFLAYVFFDMKLTAKMIQNPDPANYISPGILKDWCRKLTGYFNFIKELIDSTHKDDKQSPEPETPSAVLSPT